MSYRQSFSSVFFLKEIKQTSASVGSPSLIQLAVCRNTPGNLTLQSTGTSGMPLLVLLSTLPPTERQHMHDSLDDRILL